MSTIAQTPAEKAIQERDRLYRHYRTAKKAELDRLCADERYGERLKKFAATLGHFGIEDAEDMIRYVRKSAEWLRSAPADIRFAALQLCSDRIIRIRAKAGLLPFDDPLPGERDDLFQQCKEALS